MKKPDKKYPNQIRLPDDFDIPDTEDGKTFESVAEIRKDGDRYCVVSLDGIPLKEDEESEKEDEDESLGNRAKAAMGDASY